MNLPISINPLEYGQLLAKEVLTGSIKYIVKSSTNKFFEIISNLEGTINNVTLLGPSELKWTDTIINGDYFKREIGKSTIYFLDGEEVLRKQLLPSKAFRKTRIEKYLQEKFVTMDLETIQKDNKLVPYLICGYNGSDYAVSYAENNLSQNDLFKRFLDQLLTFFNKSKRLLIYAHNLSNFDGLFLLKHLINYGEVKPLYFNGKLISIEVKLNVKGYEGKVLLFKDSYLLLPYSLRILCETFKIDSIKSYFPFSLTNINYTGVFPKIENWGDISPAVFDKLKAEFKNKMWSFKQEAIKYCKLDCKSLYQVLTIFNFSFFNEFKINVHSVLTAPALSMKLFKTHFMPENTIFQLSGLVEENIRESYTGGAVDVYIPHNKIGTYSISNTFRTLYAYDVNSLYPYVMANKDLPIGKPIAFEGNILKYEPNAYGFFYCKITSPNYLEHPILQRRIKTSSGIRTIAGLGTWTGWIYSEEMYNAIKFGYTFEIFKGYTFDKGNLFKDFINKLYQLRQEYHKGHPMNEIAKLIMNSYYGKFGMRDEITKMEIYSTLTPEDKALLDSILDLYNSSITDILQLENHTIIVRNSLIDLTYNEKEDFYHGNEVNVAIASAITAEARIHMSQFKNNPNFRLYYSDTDSCIFDSPLPDSMVGTALGLFKLEHKIEKAIFLAPKVYAFITEEGDEVIKIKGLKHDMISKLHFSDIESLLIFDSKREFNQEKWFKSAVSGVITTADVIYTLKNTSTKRLQIYDNGIFINTKPYNYNEIEVKSPTQINK